MIGDGDDQTELPSQVSSNPLLRLCPYAMVLLLSVPHCERLVAYGTANTTTYPPPESLHEAFREIGDTLAAAAEQSRPEAPWKAIVKTYLSPEYCEHAERGCPLTTLAPELARAEKGMRDRILAELVNYKDRMIPFMPGRRIADKERAFFVIFSTMVGAVEIARMLPDRVAQEKVLAGARDFLLQSF